MSTLPLLALAVIAAPFVVPGIVAGIVLAATTFLAVGIVAAKAVRERAVLLFAAAFVAVAGEWRVA